MSDHKIEFQNIAWEPLGIGAKQKLFETNTQKVRLLYLDDRFIELDWCTKGHIGYVLKGSFTLIYTDKTVEYNEGNAFVINKGENEKHKALISKGHFVELLLIEEEP